MRTLFSIQDRSENFDLSKFATPIGLTNANFAVTTNRPKHTRQDQVEMKENTRVLRLPGSSTGILVQLSLLELPNTAHNQSYPLSTATQVHGCLRP